MQKLYKAVVALLVALALAWTPSFTSVASADEEHAHAGIFVMTDGVYVTGELGSGLNAPLEEDEVFHVYYDTTRLGGDCFPIEEGEKDSLELTGNFTPDSPVILQNIHQIAGQEFEADYVMVSPPPANEDEELHAPLCSTATTMTMTFVNLQDASCYDQASVPVSCD
ncbi:MAG: hypothetical protein F6J89_00285 [Symploca sp. SIO1C4]|uniref:Uncharacterized protein n=1 Tax=Symploca sp. SIO1C4 TaxID=2607765 RepID=A0A6B3NAC4_9CYAN|nr:hypothetical protein [Symploca sp. SIO1C4]